MCVMECTCLLLTIVGVVGLLYELFGGMVICL